MAKEARLKAQNDSTSIYIKTLETLVLTLNDDISKLKMNSTSLTNTLLSGVSTSFIRAYNQMVAAELERITALLQSANDAVIKLERSKTEVVGNLMGDLANLDPIVVRHVS